MVNAEHVAILKKGTEAWNAWRNDNPHIRPDLSAAVHIDIEAGGWRTFADKADLSGADLRQRVGTCHRHRCRERR